MRLVLKLLAPYFAVGLFWCAFGNAWLAILAYHAQIVLWSWESLRGLQRPRFTRTVLLALPAALVGPLLYVLLPHIVHTDLSSWLESHRLSRLSLAAMIPYFGLVHPLLEQVHWAPLRRSTPAAHFMFAGYHVLVLFSLLTVPWLVVCFLVLATASVAWKRVVDRSGSTLAPVVSHVLADLGVVLAAWFRTS